MLILVIIYDILSHTSHMPQMENTCSPLEILDDDDGRADEVDDNKPIQVGTPRVEWAIGDLPILMKKLRASPSSLSSDLTELSQLKREQMLKNDKYQIMQFGIEERKLELLEQELTIKMEKLKAEAAREHLNVQKERLQLKVDLLRSYLRKVYHKTKLLAHCQCLTTLIIKNTNLIITAYSLIRI